MKKMLKDGENFLKGQFLIFVLCIVMKSVSRSQTLTLSSHTSIRAR